MNDKNIQKIKRVPSDKKIKESVFLKVNRKLGEKIAGKPTKKSE